MQIQSPVDYSSIIKGFKKSHPRGAWVVEKVYGNQDSRLLGILSRREWHRFYIYKRLVRLLNKHFAGQIGRQLITWLVDETPKGQQTLGGLCEKLCQLSPNDGLSLIKELDLSHHWA